MPGWVCGRVLVLQNMPSYPWCEKLQFTYGNMRSVWMAIIFGGFSEYIYQIEPGTRLYKIPDALPDKVAVLTEVLCGMDVG